MKLFVFFLLAFTHHTTANAQVNPGDYFYLNVQYYTEGEEKHLGVSPEIRPTAPGNLGRAMNKYPRRFRYILLNKSHFQNHYDSLYPDTIRINRLYTTALSKDSLFVRYFNWLARPFIRPDMEREKYNGNELMLVAARFFSCDGVRKDSTISSHICINLNGLKDAGFAKDYTLLEAFCFEAIFESLDKGFVENFKRYIREGEQANRTSGATLDGYLIKVRQYCFSRMEKDESLKQALVEYYTRNTSNLPFVITDHAR